MGIYKFIKSFLIVKVNNVVNFIELKSILIINLNTKITKIPEHIVFIWDSFSYNDKSVLNCKKYQI